MGTLYQNTPILLFDASNSPALGNWQVVNDGVMGGISEGNLERDDKGNVRFYGTVRLENNGGFSLVRLRMDPLQIGNSSYAVLHIKGDGKTYQFRIKEDAGQRYSYVQRFETSGEWQTLKLPLHNFYPAFRGNRLDQPNFKGERIGEIAFLIGNKRKEDFSLKISKVALE